MLAISGLGVEYRLRSGSVAAVRGVDLELRAGETLALVGESGSGKSTTAHAVAGLLAPSALITAGPIRFDGTDLVRLGERRRRALRGVEIGLIPQDPSVSLNPVQRIGDQIAEVFTIHGLADKRAARRCGARRAWSPPGSTPSAPTSTRTSCPAGCASGC